MTSLILGRPATPEEQKVIDEANALLGTVHLELIGTRPKDR